MKNNGYSIIEILIVIAIMSILAGGIFSVYRFIAKETAWRHYVAKNEMDVSVFLNQIIKDIETSGFGIDSLNLTRASLSSETVGGKSFSKLTVPGLAFRAERWSGCWAELNNGSITNRSKNLLGQNCQFPNEWYVVLEPYTKKNLCPQNTDYLCNSLSGMTGLVFYATNNNSYKYPDSFMLTYGVNQTNLPKECASGTYNLVKTLGTIGQPGYQANQPVISCIFPRGFVVRVGIDSGTSINYTNNLSSAHIQNKNLKLFRICLITQVGYKQDTSATEYPQFSSDCGGGPTIDTTWWNNTGRWYRWKVIEQDIPLKNYQ
ncbi:prepilin-type N-terminal cleavage/methylation domain-containing protein [Thermodesulfovibrio sp. 1176]|uniref:prepilin-type N-terminal cleavage/methylation domain-containing protein n=1 Tax=Thermodesulfovibrio sp. 1176 TaxID=3043424 RepID=UPI00248298F4|nr:prepilin-type N-terminal cleavage/methylation domain-containing protein [Thermodesulfovibrio sp. 1176]MDI1471136.1 prepilin-type N-terminal cleavage/methylation domain-containing protein [Thermodesulfovibrio sp. 1176]